MDGALVGVGVDLAQGLAAFTIVGLSDTAVSEAKERVVAADVAAVRGKEHMKRALEMASAGSDNAELRFADHFRSSGEVGLSA